MTGEQEYPFAIRGRVSAASADEAHGRVLRALRIFGFGEVGDGSLWLDRPKGPMDDVGMALGDVMFSVDEIEVDDP